MKLILSLCLLISTSLFSQWRGNKQSFVCLVGQANNCSKTVKSKTFKAYTHLEAKNKCQKSFRKSYCGYKKIKTRKYGRGFIKYRCEYAKRYCAFAGERRSLETYALNKKSAKKECFEMIGNNNFCSIKIASKSLKKRYKTRTYQCHIILSSKYYSNSPKIYVSPSFKANGDDNARKACNNKVREVRGIGLLKVKAIN